MVIYKAVNSHVQLARLNILCLGLEELSEWGCQGWKVEGKEVCTTFSPITLSTPFLK